MSRGPNMRIFWKGRQCGNYENHWWKVQMRKAWNVQLTLYFFATATISLRRHNSPSILYIPSTITMIFFQGLWVRACPSAMASRNTCSKWDGTARFPMCPTGYYHHPSSNEMERMHHITIAYSFKLLRLRSDNLKDINILHHFRQPKAKALNDSISLIQFERYKWTKLNCHI